MGNMSLLFIFNNLCFRIIMLVIVLILAFCKSLIFMYTVIVKIFTLSVHHNHLCDFKSDYEFMIKLNCVLTFMMD
jgi:hypothetical protein